MYVSWLRPLAVALLFLLTATASLAGADEKNPLWRKRSGSAAPVTKEEKLAIELIARQEHVLKRDRYTVQFDGERGEYAQVSVRRVGGEGDVDVISRFLVKEGKIAAYADPLYEQAPKKVDPRRRENALKVAHQTKAGDAPNRPDIYNGFMYTAVIDENCMAVVTERDAGREVVGTYEFDLCK